jgi:hypothetical protein
MNILSLAILLTEIVSFTTSSRLRGIWRRGQTEPYISTSDPSILGDLNFEASIDNPLKGLLTSPRWVGSDVPDSIPSSMEFYYLGLDEIMTGPNEFNWTVLDQTLETAIGRNNHVIWRVFTYYPGQALRIPQYLLNAGIRLVDTSGGKSPDFNDPTLLEAFEQFITAFGARYDGAKGLAFIQLGLLGFWGEWHTSGTEGILDESTMDKVVGWYADAFQTTPLQTRYPLASAYAAGIGLHDDSFAYSTLDGEANGGVDVEWFFWSRVESSGQTDFWKRAPMGGETRPEVQSEVFQADYMAGTENKQNFQQCIDITHATYLFHHNAFINGGYEGTELENARRAHASMGYNFQVTEVKVAAGTTGLVDVSATVKQVGVAPFYYPLRLTLKCQGTSKSAEGVETLVNNGDVSTFTFTGIPANAACLNEISFQLESDFTLPGRPIKFAQGVGTVSLSLPTPEQATSFYAEQTGNTSSQQQGDPMSEEETKEILEMTLQWMKNFIASRISGYS